MTHKEFRRKREGKTDYKKRLRLLSSSKPRLTIRFSLKNILIQIVNYNEKGDIILTSSSSKDLEKLGWKAGRNNLPASYLTGYLIGKKAIKMDIKEVIPDIGFKHSMKSGRLYSAIKGVLDAGVKVPCSEEILPKDELIKGTNIANYAQKLAKEGKYEQVFSGYIKKDIKAEEIPKYFEETKKKIDQNG